MPVADPTVAHTRSQQIIEIIKPASGPSANGVVCLCCDRAINIWGRLRKILSPVTSDHLRAAIGGNFRSAHRRLMKTTQPVSNAINDGLGNDLARNHPVEHSLTGKPLHQYTVINDPAHIGKLKSRL